MGCTSVSGIVPGENGMQEENALHHAAASGDLAELKHLLQSGASATCFDEIDWTPLHHAVRAEQFEVTRYLLSLGVDVNIQNSDSAGETPLGASIEECSYQMAKFLIDAGADPRLPGWMGLNAIDRAKRRSGKEAKALLVLLARRAGWLDRGESHDDVCND